MYYYIAEPLITKSEKRKVDEIKSMLSQLGIAGEFAVASPARTVEEHLELAFAKGFSTIVGMGSDALLCRVAAKMLEKNYSRAVLGAIPLSSDQRLWEMMGVTTLAEIGDALRTRFLQPIDVLELGAGQAIIVEASIRRPHPVRFQLRYKGAVLLGRFTDLTIKPSGEVNLYDQTAKRNGNWFSRLLGSKNDPSINTTHLESAQWELATDEPCEVTVGSQTVGQTPLSVKSRPKCLKLIVNRAIIAPDRRQTAKE